MTLICALRESSFTSHQLGWWLAGISLHDRSIDQCCPDFSCCAPRLAATHAEKKRFLAADPESRAALLIEFIGRASADFASCISVGLPSLQHGTVH